MSISYVLRHGRTELSAKYIASGDPTTRVRLDATGVAQCRRGARAAWIPRVATCIVSAFPRTAETAELLLGDHRPEMVVDHRLNEINYGEFEGQPWLAYGRWLRSAGPAAVPPRGEARNTAISRMLEGLAACMHLPGPRMIVGHGLMISALLQLLLDRSLDTFELPEAPYVAPIPLTDSRLAELLRDAARRCPARAQDRHGPALA